MSRPSDALVTLATTGVDWFPQQYADTFNLVKGVVGIAAVLFLIAHMDRAWRTEALTLGRRLRYLALLAFVIVVAGGSVEQINQDALVNYRNLGAMVATVLGFAAAVVSIWESRHRDQSR